MANKRNKFNLREVAEAFKAAEPKLMTTLEIQSIDEFVMSWKHRGFSGGWSWEPPLRTIQGTKAYNSASKAARTRAWLVQSGALRRGFYTRVRRMGILVIANSMPYARIHNEGGIIHKKARHGSVFFKLKKNGDFAGDGRARFTKKRHSNYERYAFYGEHNIIMPKRQFMGHSFILGAKHIKAIRATVMKCLRAK